MLRYLWTHSQTLTLLILYFFSSYKSWNPFSFFPQFHLLESFMFVSFSYCIKNHKNMSSNFGVRKGEYWIREGKLQIHMSLFFVSLQEKKKTFDNFKKVSFLAEIKFNIKTFDLLHYEHWEKRHWAMNPADIQNKHQNILSWCPQVTSGFPCRL